MAEQPSACRRATKDDQIKRRQQREAETATDDFARREPMRRQCIAKLPSRTTAMS
jgi:hypothetical protein